MPHYHKIFFSSNFIILDIFWSILSLFVIVAGEDYFQYSIGDLKIFCPKPENEWKAVGTDCFKKLPQNLQFDWSEANLICQLSENGASQILHLDNFFLHKELSRILELESNGASQEFWTAWYLNLSSDSALPERVLRFGSNQTISIYNPIWAALEPQLGGLIKLAGKWCISWDSLLSSENQFGWRIRNCTNLLPTICQTFPCYMDSNSKPQHRCSDNSACISHKAICDDYMDCANGEDEANCGCQCPTKMAMEKIDAVKELGAPFGNIYPMGWRPSKINGKLEATIRAAAGNCTQRRRQEWGIKQKAGARIKLDFLSLHLQSGDKILVADRETGEVVEIPSNLGTYSTILAMHNLKIIFENNGDANHQSGFQLQYAIDDSSICHRHFESWNGTFSVPMRIPDNGLYKTPIECQWTIENGARGIVSIIFHHFDLAPADWLALTVYPNQLISNFSSLKSPPTALLLYYGPQMNFHFNALKNSLGGRGFEATFERACINQLIDFGPSGTIEIPSIGETRTDPLHCSWIIKVPCKQQTGEEYCPFTIFLDNFTSTADDRISFKSDDGNVFTVDTSKKLDIPFQFRVISSSAKIRIKVNSQHFRAKIAYSIDCSSPRNVHLIQMGPKFPFRSIVDFTCPRGGGSGKLICAERGKWKFLDGNGRKCFLESQKIIINELAAAGSSLNLSSICVVPIIENGHILELDRKRGRLIYECRFGYNPMGPKQVECSRADRNWIPAPKCEEILCPEASAEIVPPSIRISSSQFFVPAKLVSKSRGSQLASRAFYKCPAGSIQRGLIEQPFSECLENGTWRNAEIACLVLGCAPILVQFGNFTKSWTPLFDYADIQCVEGTTFKGDPPQCLLNGDKKAYWAEIPADGLKCEFPNSCGKFAPQNPCGPKGECIPRVDGNYTCSCERGHRFERNATVGEQCKAIDECAEGSALCSGGKCQQKLSEEKEDNNNNKYECICPQTHMLYRNGTKNLQIPSKKALIDQHSCIRQRCPIPLAKNVDKFFLHPSNDDQQLHLAGTNLSIYCQFGDGNNSALIGPEAQIHCQGDGKWEGKMPEECTKAISCAPPNLPNAATKIKGRKKAEYSVNAIIQFECDNEQSVDYAMVGAAKAICLPTGQWTNAAPVCTVPQCSPIQIGRRQDGLDIELGHRPKLATEETFRIGTKLEMKCKDEGDKIAGNWSLICMKCAAADCLAPLWSMEKLPNCEEMKNDDCQLPERDERSLLIWAKTRMAFGESVTFGCAQPNYQLSDQTPRICVKRKSKMMGKRRRRKREENNEEEEEEDWRPLIDMAIPSTVIAFESRKQIGGWKSSIHWTQLGNGAWNYRPVGDGKNFLISPMVEVTAKDWLDASVELSPIPCPNCLVWLSYFSAERTTNEPPTMEHFTPLGGVLADPTVHAIQFSLEHPHLWIQISVDAQSPELQMDRLKVTITACPRLQLGLTLFPRTPVKSENRTVQGQCVNGNNNNKGGAGAMALICSPLGKWIPPNEIFHDTCKCPVGLRAKSNGECAPKDGILCHSCSSQSDQNCLSAVLATNKDASKKCGPEELCFVRSTSNRTGQMPFQIARGCANRVECGILQSNISVRESCKTSLEGIETCTACCSDDFCNSKLPSQLLSKKVSPTPFPITTMPPKLPQISLENDDFDGPLPECIDQQPLELQCPEKLQINRIGPQFTEPILIPWPRVIDNDPNFNLRPLNIPLAHPDEPISLKGDEQEILWRAEDRHGFMKICATKIEFLDKIGNGKNAVLAEGNAKIIECPDIFIQKVNSTIISTNRIVPAEYPPIKFNSPGGSRKNLKLSFDPPAGSPMELDVPTLIKVNIEGQNIDGGNCQFWYQIKVTDCPRWQLGPDHDQFECTNHQSDGIVTMVKCFRRSPCADGREYPVDLRELRCRIGSTQGWTYINGQGAEKELGGEPICIKEMSSTITLSMELVPIGPSNGVNCMRHLAQRIRPHLVQFFHEHCPEVEWRVQSHSVQSQLIVQNFSTTTHNTRDVLLCIQLLTTQLAQSLPKQLNPPLPPNECPFGPLSARRQTIAYHLHCPTGWTPNDQLRCEICQMGHFAFNETCKQCPKGTFSPMAGAEECRKCPPGTSTAKEGTARDSECIPLCPVGFQSPSGLAPCHRCPFGTFQSKEGQSECMPCTENVDPKYQMQCKAECPQGHFMSVSLNDCRPCPKGFFQPMPNSKSCFPCPDGTSTPPHIPSGASNAEQCISDFVPPSICPTLGFTGPNCSIPFDLCAAEFCLNGGSCSFDKRLGSKCSCKKDFTGLRCEIGTNGVKDLPKEGEFKKNLMENFAKNSTLANCGEKDATNQCPNGKCNGQICECNAGFKMGNGKGAGGGVGICMVESDVCAFSKPCQKSGECQTRNGGKGEFKCECKNGNEGEFCELPRGNCFSEHSRCLNGGKCAWTVAESEHFNTKCLCPPSFEGDHCETAKELPIQKCLRERWCGANGNCKMNEVGPPEIGVVFCECDKGFFGEFCESHLSPCSSLHPKGPRLKCKNGGICQLDENNEAFCKCTEGWTGKECEKMNGKCDGGEEEGEDCLNNGEGGGQCPLGFSGAKCEIKLDACAFLPAGFCVENCKATFEKGNGIVQMECKCPTNDDCLKSNVNICNASNICKNGGICISQLAQTKCDCPHGFYGPICENAVNYCALNEICLNGAKCRNGENGREYKCECDEQAGLTGLNCENNYSNGQQLGSEFPSGCDDSDFFEENDCSKDPCKMDKNYCNGVGECRLLPNSRNPYCHCLPEFTGIRCDKKKPAHFNLYFAGPEAKANSPILQQIQSPQFKCAEILSDFAFCLWVRLGEININLFKHFPAKGPKKNAKIAILKMIDGGSLFEFQREFVVIFTEGGNQLNIPYGKNADVLNEGAWHHICLTSSIGFSSNANVALYFDGSFSSNIQFKLNATSGLEEDRKCHIILAPEDGDNSPPFVGQISLAELYKQQSLDEYDIGRMSNYCQKWTNFPREKTPQIGWTAFTSVDVFNSAQIQILPGICSNYNCQPGEADCNGEKNAKSPPEPIGCPKSQYVYVPDSRKRLATVEWDDGLEVMFRQGGPYPIVRFESNFRPGQTFGWGYYRVVYMAEDSAGNWATCEFDIVIGPAKCQEPMVDPQKYTLLYLQEMDWEDDPQAAVRAQLQCRDQEEFVFNTARPPFYTCDRLGQWNHWEKFGAPFILPSCSPTDNALQNVQGDVHFAGSCQEREKHVEDVIHCVLNASKQLGGFCERENCEGQLAVKTDCMDTMMIGRMEGDGRRGPIKFTLDTMVAGQLRRRRARKDEGGGGGGNTVRVQFDLNVNNTKRVVGPVIRDSMEAWFGGDFKGEQIRLSCSDTFPQLHIDGENGGRVASSVAESPDPLTVQCATCAPGETWQSNERKIATTTKSESVVNADASGNCVKCPADTYKPKEGVQPCTQCPDERITGGITGCMHLADCFVNCDPGSIYDWDVDGCRPCPRGQFMQYSGRLKCLACPAGKTTESEGSTSEEQCSLHCPAGEEMGAEEHCKRCKKGTFRTDKMDACKQCELGFSTKFDGSKSPEDCNEIYCPPGYKAIGTTGRSQTESEFAKICQPCPIGYYQNHYGSLECIRCPANFITRHSGARSLLECDQPWDGSCKPDEPNPCPSGMKCVQVKGSIFECHSVPVQQDDEIENENWKRLWIPIGLSLVSVLALAILLLLFLLNRKRWLLMFHRHFPKAALLCCKKMTVDNLSNSDFARNDAPPIGNNPPAHQEAAISLGPHQIRVESDEPHSSVNNNNDDDEGMEAAKKIAIVRPQKGQWMGRAASSSSSSSSSGARSIKDPLHEIRTSLMEVLNNAEVGCQPLDENGTDENCKEKTELKQIRPKLTVQTGRDEYGRGGKGLLLLNKMQEKALQKFDNGALNRSIRPRGHRRSSSSSTSSSSSSFARESKKSAEISNGAPPRRFYSGGQLMASALATDAIGRRVFGMDEEEEEQYGGMEGGGGGDANVGRGIAGLRRSKSPMGAEKKLDISQATAGHHLRTLSSLTGQTQNSTTNVSIRRIQLERQMEGGNAGGVPFQTALRASLTARNRMQGTGNIPPTMGKMQEKKTTKTVPPSYDDDDDAFFS